jgi:hypothetical protein
MTTSSIVSIKNPKWSNKSHTAIDCNIFLAELGGVSIPFTASIDDCEPHGKEIFQLILDGKFGGIDEFVPNTNQVK